VPQGELLESGNTREALTPVQLELIETASNQDEKMIRRLIPLIKGVILAETGNLKGAGFLRLLLLTSYSI
jgi:hypothetical protein